MVSSCHYLATFAGARMFERGGNAIDAGVAAGLAIERLAERIREWPTSAEVFLPNGRPPHVGEIFVQRDLGALFRRLAAIERVHQGAGRANAIMAARDSIYQGDIAAQIAAFMREA